MNGAHLSLHESRSRIGEQGSFILTEGKQLLPYGQGKKKRTPNPVICPLITLIIRLNELIVLRWGPIGDRS